MDLDKLWSASDDEGLYQAWLRVCPDSSKGTWQKSEMFLSCVAEHLKEQSESNQRRGAGSVESRWGTTQSRVSRICTMWNQMYTNSEDGVVQGDIFDSALETYQPSTSKELGFDFVPSWPLREPHWIEPHGKETLTRRKARTRGDDEDSGLMADSEVDNSESPYPAPQQPHNLDKLTKTKGLKRLRLLETQANAARMLAETNMKQVQIMRLKFHIKLFKKQDEQLPEASHRYFAFKRAQVLRELEAESHSV